MRVTDRMGHNQVIRNLQKNRGEMTEFQNQAATQKRINRPSDDPVAAARVLGTRTEDRGTQQFLKNIAMARSFLEYSEQSLNELSDILVRAKELAIQQASDAGASSETRRVAAEEVEQAFNQAVQIGNRKLGERYVFGGYHTNVSPFTPKGDYQGDDADIHIPIDKDATIVMNVPGNRAFLGEFAAEDGLVRPRSEPPKTLQQLEAYQENEKSREKDRGEARGAEIHLKGPQTEYDRRRAPAVESVPSREQTGTNVFKALKDFEIALRTNDKAEVQESIDHIDEAISQIVLTRAQIGSRVQNINKTQEGLQKSLVDNRSLASGMEDADLFQVVSDMTKTDSALKATLETSGRILHPSLLDFLK